METTLAYWFDSGQMISPEAALLWLLLAVCLAWHLKSPGEPG